MGSAAGSQRCRELPPRRRHINGCIVKVLCAWSNGGTGAGRHQNEPVKWVWVPISYTQPEIKQTNVVVTMVMRHIFEIS